MSTSNKNNQPLNYKSAGVDIHAGDALIKRIKPFCEKTSRPEIVSDIGGFAGLFRLSASTYQRPMLVSATDGVGTKLKLAQQLNRHDTIGIDLVAMCVNDVLALGAEPILFLDYFACGKLSVDNAATVIQGIATACELAGCSLIGGETAEMPGMYQGSDYDLAGFCVGLVEEDAVCGRHRVNNGDALIGLASSGPHANGYSLIREIIQHQNIDLAQKFDGRTMGEVLLEPTRIYVRELLPLLSACKIEALAHITGGGITENLPRVLQQGQAAKLNLHDWQRPAIFDCLQQNGNIEEVEMRRVFNCGIGMILIVKQENVAKVMDHLGSQNYAVAVIGEVIRTPKEENACVIYD